MRSLTRLACAALLTTSTVFSAACSDKKSSADAALDNDLSLAAQQRTAPPLDSISAVEQGYTANGARAYAPSGAAAAPVRHTTTRRSSSSSGSYSSAGSSGGTYTAPAPQRTVTVKHTQRDAAIGAAAGAVIGATTSKNKVQGGIIGAAAGGILGGVIGNNVDKKTKKVP